MKRIILLVVFAVCCHPFLFPQNVTNISAEQVGKVIHVNYDLEEAADISLFVSTDGGKTFIELRKVSGDIGRNISSGHNLIIWDVLTEFDAFDEKDVVFKVLAVGVCPPTMSDYDGNVYNTVKIGNQCWMRENLRTTHYSDGTPIKLDHENTYDDAIRCYPGNDSSYITIFGYLYNWRATMYNSKSCNSCPSSVQGICPVGWHVPSDAEWTQLTQFVCRQNEYLCGKKNIAKALSSTSRWSKSKNNCAIGNDLKSNNMTGFAIEPAGYWDGWANVDCGDDAAYLWTSTQVDYRHAYYRSFDHDNGSVYRGSGFLKLCALSVRCIKD